MLDKLLEKNAQWAADIIKEDPLFFTRLAEQQSPEYLWIGCSDSRVPANQLLGLMPGDVFVHRNIANLVLHTDLNCMSVIKYAVNVLKVKHIIVTGHYDCGGIRAAMQKQSSELIDGWLRNIKDIYYKHRDILHATMTEKEQLDCLTELNVVEQVKHVCYTNCVQEAWKSGQDLTVHGLIYSVKNGRLKDLKVNFDSIDSIDDLYHIS